MAAVGAIMDALASQIETTLCGTANPLIEQLQVDGRFVFNPTPPSIDVYPGDPFQEPLTMGSRELHFIVRARISTAAHEEGQDLLLSLMDATSATSLSGAIKEDTTLGGVIDNLRVDGPSGFGAFPNASGIIDGSLLGATWTVVVYP